MSHDFKARLKGGSEFMALISDGNLLKTRAPE
jgi:hypothetical protein